MILPKQRPEKGRGLFLTRDSGGKHEMTPGKYVEWAIRKAAELGIQFNGTADIIESMIRDRVCHRGDIFLDYDVSGEQLSRPALNKLKEVAHADGTVTHIFIPRPDRLARPDEAIAGMDIENGFRRLGLTIVYMTKTLRPLAIGQRHNLADQLTSLMDFDRASEDLRELAEKMIYAQLGMAAGGYTAGGRPPFAFRRWLIKADGTKLRELQDGERIRMAGHHVCWLPVPEGHPEMKVVRRILELIEIMPASRVAAILTAEGVPTPDANRWRTDRGISHKTSGVWHSNTVTGIARNPLLRAVSIFGRRSMGKHLRFTPTGPRELIVSDYRQDGKRKVIANPVEVQVTKEAFFEPLVAPAEHEVLVKKLDDRGKTQRGKPRSQDPEKNPLGGRVFDISCGWLMYRAPYNGGFRYVCGLYTQSHGQRCNHHHVDGIGASRFLVSCIWKQGVLSPRIRQRVHERLSELIAARHATDGSPDVVASLKKQQLEVRAQLPIVERNLGLAESAEVFRSVSKTFQELKAREQRLAQELATATSATRTQEPNQQLMAAIDILDRLPELAADPANLGAVTTAFNLLNVRLFASFRPEVLKKRTVHRLEGGTVTFGTAEPPVPLYEGPTARKRIKSEAAAAIAVQSGGDVPLPNPVGSGREGKSLGNVSRGDRI
jgi:Recombinase